MEFLFLGFAQSATSPITPAAPFPPGFGGGGGAKEDWFAHMNQQQQQQQQQAPPPQPSGDLLGDWSTHFSAGAGGTQMKHAHSASNLDGSQNSQIPRNPSNPHIGPNQQFPGWRPPPPSMGPRVAGPMGGGWSSPQMGRPGGYPPGAPGMGNTGNPGMAMPPRQQYRPPSTFNPAAFVMNQQKEVNSSLSGGFHLGH